MSPSVLSRLTMVLGSYGTPLMHVLIWQLTLVFPSMIFGVAFALACAVGNRHKLYADVDRVGCLWPVRYGCRMAVAKFLACRRLALQA